GIVDDHPKQTERAALCRMRATGRKLDEVALDQTLLYSVPDPELAVLRVEGNELQHSERTISGELLRPSPAGSIVVAAALDGTLRRAPLPHLPDRQTLVLHAEAYEDVGRQTLLRVARVEIHELPAANARLLAVGELQAFEEAHPPHEMLSQLI